MILPKVSVLLTVRIRTQKHFGSCVVPATVSPISKEPTANENPRQVMSIQSLPNEVLEFIFDEILPKDWNRSQNGTRWLQMRLVSSNLSHYSLLCLTLIVVLFTERFDAIVSRQSLQKLHLHAFLIIAPRLNPETVTWLLHQRLSQFNVLHDEDHPSIQLVQKTYPSRDHEHQPLSEKSSDMCMRAACSLAVAYQGVTSICKLLADPPPDLLQQLSSRSKLPLLAYCGNQNAFGVVAARGYDPGDQNGFLGPPIYAACCSGNVPVVDFLLRRKVNVNIHGDLGTPLIVAMRHQNMRLLLMLLDYDELDPNAPDARGYTALWWSCFLGYLDFTRHLLDHRKTDPDLKCQEQTPLSAAVGKGHEMIIRLLLERQDANIDFNNGTNCPLWRAVYSGQARIMQLLLSKLQFCPDDCQVNSKPLLWWAADQGRASVVQLLLKRHDVDPNFHDGGGNTPLWKAAHNGYDRVVHLLLQRQDLNPNIRFLTDATPLWIAVFQGHEPVVRSMLQYKHVNPNLKGCFGQSPLSVAAEQGRTRIVEMLLRREETDVNSVDDNGRTPVSFASEKSHELILQLLLQREEIDLDRVDHFGRTPMMRARDQGHDSVVELLLQRSSQAVNL